MVGRLLSEKLKEPDFGGRRARGSLATWFDMKVVGHARMEETHSLRRDVRGARHPRRVVGARHVERRERGDERAARRDDLDDGRHRQFSVQPRLRGVGAAARGNDAHRRAARRACDRVPDRARDVPDSADRVVARRVAAAGVPVRRGADRVLPDLHVHVQLGVRQRVRVAGRGDAQGGAGGMTQRDAKRFDAGSTRRVVSVAGRATTAAKTGGAPAARDVTRRRTRARNG
ncbi:hypothetical protein F01_490049 [Burkholderia cenocepacia]|nr:hypothetical protein F01_490049 [Burkholderia cenocepacia]